MFMKKLFYLLIGILLLPSIVKADMSAPIVIKYKAIVNNVNGVPEYKMSGEDYIKTGKTVEYGTVFTIYDEERDYVCIDAECETYAKISDLVTAEKEYKIKEESIGEKVKLTTIKKVDIKSGPANLYKTISTVKSGTTLNGNVIIKIDDSDYIEEFNPWYYVEYNGVKGFVNSYGGTMIIGNIEEEEIITGDKVDIVDINTKKVLKTLEASTKIEAKIGCRCLEFKLLH